MHLRKIKFFDLFLILLVISCSMLLINCAKVGLKTKEWKNDIDEATTKYKESIKPKIQQGFAVYFGLTNEGNYDTVAHKVMPEGYKTGIQDIGMRNFDLLSKEEKEKVRKADKKMKEILKMAKTIDKLLKEKSGNLEDLLEKIKKLNEEVKNEKLIKQIISVLKTAIITYSKMQGL